MRQLDYFYEQVERDEVEDLIKRARLAGAEVDDPEWVIEEKRDIQRQKMAIYDAQEAEYNKKIAQGIKEEIDFSKGSFFVPQKAGTRIG